MTTAGGVATDDTVIANLKPETGFQISDFPISRCPPEFAPEFALQQEVAFAGTLVRGLSKRTRRTR